MALVTWPLQKPSHGAEQIQGAPRIGSLMKPVGTHAVSVLKKSLLARLTFQAILCMGGTDPAMLMRWPEPLLKLAQPLLKQGTWQQYVVGMDRKAANLENAFSMTWLFHALSAALFRARGGARTRILTPYTLSFSLDPPRSAVPGAAVRK